MCAPVSLFLDKKYVSLIAPKLDRFQQKKEYLWVFRCPECGDSKKNKLKTRGYFYRKKSNISFICHNCHASMSLGNFIKARDPNLFQQYQMERYKEESHSNVAKPDFTMARTQPVFVRKVIDLPTVASLSDDHPAKVYCVGRNLPNLNELYYTDDFATFAQTITTKEHNIPSNDKRVVIPFLDQNNNLLGVQGRTISNSKIRYITLKVSDDAPKIYGLHKIDLTKPIYVVEGPFDSMFLPNALATMDSALSKIIGLLGDHDYIFVGDNENRNKEILREMEHSIATGKKVVVWPKTLTHKDINDMVLAGLDVKKIIDEHTYEGLRAKLEFEVWRKV